jgi:hypothetical protein
MLAFLCLDEPLAAGTILGGVMVLLGAEIVRRPQLVSFTTLCCTRSAAAAPLGAGKEPTT